MCHIVFRLEMLKWTTNEQNTTGQSRRRITTDVNVSCKKFFAHTHTYRKNVNHSQNFTVVIFMVQSTFKLNTRIIKNANTYRPFFLQTVAISKRLCFVKMYYFFHIKFIRFKMLQLKTTKRKATSDNLNHIFVSVWGGLHCAFCCVNR